MIYHRLYIFFSNQKIEILKNFQFFYEIHVFQHFWVCNNFFHVCDSSFDQTTFQTVYFFLKIFFFRGDIF